MPEHPGQPVRVEAAAYGGRPVLFSVAPIWSGAWLVPRPPREVKFLRSKGMDPLPDPDPGETIELLREFVNVEGDDDFMLLLAWLAAALRPGHPFPVLVILGEPGAAKSSTVRLLKRLIDPSRPEHRGLPRDQAHTADLLEREDA